MALAEGMQKKRNLQKDQRIEMQCQRHHRYEANQVNRVPESLPLVCLGCHLAVKAQPHLQKVHEVAALISATSH